MRLLAALAGQGPVLPSPVSSPTPGPPVVGGGIFTSSFLLSTLIWIPLAVALVMAVVPVPRRLAWVWQWTAFWTQVLIVATLSLIGYIQFAVPSESLMFEEKVPWLPALGASYHLGVDGIGMMMLLLDALITISAILATGVRERPRAHYVLILVVQSGVVGVVTAHDLFLMVTFLAGLILPVGLLILGWGGPGRAVAARRFVAYAGLGVVALALAVLLLHIGTGGTSFDFETLLKSPVTPRLQIVAGILVVVAAACWLPLVPFHGWSRQVLAEASPGVTILVAGLVTRLGGYLLLRVLVGGIHDGARLLAPFLALLAALTVAQGALAAIRGDDVRRVGAYLALIPGGMVALGVAGLTPASLSGAALGVMLGGLAAALAAGTCAIVAERANTRRLEVLGGLFGRMPFMGWVMILTAIAVLGLPTAGTYVSSLLVVLGAFGPQPVGSIGVMIGLGLAGIALAWLLYRVLFGPHPVEAPAVGRLTLSEKWALVVLVAASCWFGLLPGGPKPGGVPLAFDPGLAPMVTTSTASLADPYVSTGGSGSSPQTGPSQGAGSPLGGGGDLGGQGGLP